jgi:hypothetical protein
MIKERVRDEVWQESLGEIMKWTVQTFTWTRWVIPYATQFFIDKSGFFQVSRDQRKHHACDNFKILLT